MERLTHKHKYKKDSQKFVFDMKDYRKACQKLGQLEDIEEELGIDLITLFKALRNGFYYKDINEKVIFISKHNIFGYDARTSQFDTWFGKIYYDDKGTWALTKEELL